MGNPQKALVVAQAAGAILDIRLLHENAQAVFGPHLALVGEAPADVFLLAPDDALALKAFFEAVENLPVSGEVSRLEHGGFCHHVLVRFFDRFGDVTGGLPDLEANVPQGDDRAANDLLGLLVAGAFILEK